MTAGPRRSLPELSRLYGMTAIWSWSVSDGIIVAGQNLLGQRENWVRITSKSLTDASDPILPWYSALERLAEELRVDVDRAAIKAEVLALLQEVARP